MEGMTVEVRKDGKRKWSKEQKINIVKEFESGVNVNELSRKYNIHANMIYQWKRRFESMGKEGLGQDGEVISKSMYVSALKKIEELERALGRKTLETDILKKSLEMKGLKLPEEK
ncbi:MAG: transposase [Elusimicrobia bacterium]|nr:transposase [Elusimicrobiota bacterium]